MNKKINIFKISCYLNIGGVLGVIGFFIYQTHSLSYTNQDIFDLTWLSLIVLVYAVNFHYGIKLTSVLHKDLDTIKINQKIRKTFFAFEIIVTFFYSFLIFYSIANFKTERFWPINFETLSDLIVLICLYTGYVSSLVRIFLTNSVVKFVVEKNKKIVEQIGVQEN